MRLPVELTPEASTGLCRGCQVIGQVYQFTVLIGTGFDVTQPLCVGCLTKGTHRMEVEQAELPKGGPPTKRVKKRSQQQELELAKAVGGRVQPGSGAMPGAKGDVRKKGKLRVEAKMTYANSYSLTLATLHKIRSECVGMEKSALVVAFIEKGTERQREAYAVVPLEDWEDMVNAPRNNL